jgi:hypothetical protein
MGAATQNPQRVSSTPLSKFEQFTDAEQLAIATHACSNPLTMLFMMKFIMSDRVRSDDPRIAQGKAYLASAGIISPERLDQVFPS